MTVKRTACGLRGVRVDVEETVKVCVPPHAPVDFMSLGTVGLLLGRLMHETEYVPVGQALVVGANGQIFVGRKRAWLERVDSLLHPLRYWRCKRGR